jgi:hypothetical protein
MRWTRLVLSLMVVMLGTLPLAAAPLFPDVPENHWARDAVAALAAKGLVEGYPDGTFKGDRAASRWEVAMIVARLLAKMEQEHATFATKAELEELRKLTLALQEELDALGVRVTNLEEQTSRLSRRVRELERIRYYGRMHSIVVSQGVSGDAPFIGTPLNPGIDWSTGRLLTRGTGFTALGILGLNADITKDIVAGAEFAAFSSQGDQFIDSYWGISAPWQQNPWTARTSPLGALASGQQPANNTPFTRWVLDNFWVRHKPSDTRLTVGSYFKKYFAPFVFQGPRNPNVHQPRWLPNYGADVSGRIGGPDSGFYYEALYSINPEASTYRNHTLGATLRYEFPGGRGRIAAHVARTLDENVNNGVINGAGLIPIPAVPFNGPGAPPVPPGAWAGLGGNTFFVGPQSQNTFGGELVYAVLLEPEVRLYGEYARSSYNPDTTRTLFATTVTGNLYRFGIEAEPIERLNLRAEFVRTDPTYDPFQVQYPTPTGTLVFLPFATYYSDRYQLHDYILYPNNRQGVRFRGDYTLEDRRTNFFLFYNNLWQVAATTPAQVQTPGNIEPLFPLLQAGGSQIGRVQGFGVGAGHRFEMGLRVDASYYRYSILRGAPAVDDVDLLQNVYRIELGYPVVEDITLKAGYHLLTYSGHSGIANTDFDQHIPSVGADFRLSPTTMISLDYRLFFLDNDALAASNYQASQLMMEMKVDF